MDINWTYHQIYNNWYMSIIYHNKDFISNSTCSSKNHPLFSSLSLNELTFDPTNV